MRWVSLALSCLLAGAGFRTSAAALATEPSTDLSFDSRISAIATSLQGTVASVWLERSGALPAELVILDTSDPKHLRTLGRIATEGVGALSLNEDGTLALLAIETETTQYTKATKQVVLAVDLTNPSVPRQLWRREVTAYKVGLGDSASSYYVVASTPTENTDGKRSLSIVRLPEGKVVELAVPRYSRIQYRVSANGRFLLSSDDSSLDIRDLDAPASITTQKYYGTSRYVCAVDMFSNGDTVMLDSRAARLALYANRESIPRLATLDIATPNYFPSGCVSRIGGDGRMLFIYDGRSIGKVDFVDHQKPLQTDQWLVPGYGPPLAIGGNTLFAAIGSGGRTLRVVSLQPGTRVAPVPFDWKALDSTYEVAMKQFREDTIAGKPLPATMASITLGNASIVAAADLAVTGISSRKAAAILNDYGYFLTRGYGSSLVAERVLRRAIELDPERKVAYLNLGDLLRKGLPLESNWQKKVTRKVQADEAYRQYIALGGNATTEIIDFIGDDWTAATPATFCSAVAKMANQDRLSELVSAIGINLPTGSTRVDVKYTTEGTAHVPATYVADSSTDFLAATDLPLPVDGEGLWGGDNLGLLVYAGAYHTLHYKDLTHPTASISTDGKTACTFNVNTTEVLDTATRNPRLCLQILHGNRPAALSFKGTSWMTNGDVAARYSQTRIDGVASMDVLGDGSSMTVAKMALSSGAGPGCEKTFFDLLDRNAARFEDGVNRDLLMHMQKADPTDRYPLRCGNDPRFFEDSGKIYFENRPAVWPPTNAWDQYHFVTQIENGQAIDVCRFRFDTQVAGKTVSPQALKQAPPK